MVENRLRLGNISGLVRTSVERRRELCSWHRNSECRARTEVRRKFDVATQCEQHLFDQRKAESSALCVLSMPRGLALKEGLEDRAAQARLDARSAILHTQVAGVGAKLHADHDFARFRE